MGLYIKKKKKQGFVWEGVLMSRKWGGIQGDREGHGKNVANYSWENKSAIIYE